MNPTPRLFLAPMAGITDWPFRFLCLQMGADETVTEMISAQGLMTAPAGNTAYAQLLSAHETESRLSAQIFGYKPDYVARATKLLSSMDRFIGVDLNFGCPARKVTGSGSGSALMQNLKLSAQVITAARNACKKRLSVKMRLGWDEKSRNYLEFARMAEDCGVDLLCVHGRTREQQYAGKADWNAIAQVKAHVKIPVIANGDVCTPQDAVNILSLTGADGVAIGRGALGNPFIFRQARQALSGQTVVSPQEDEILLTALSHLRMMASFKGERSVAIEMRKHLGWYLRGSRGCAQTRIKINHAQTTGEMESALIHHFKEKTDQTQSDGASIDF